MTAEFDRYGNSMSRSFSLRAFNKCETEINEHFWSFKVISEYSRFIAQAEKRKNVHAATAEVFMAKGPDAERIPPTVSKWLEAREQLENWLRLGALVSASSYLEVYLTQIVRSALMADPLCRFGASRKLDGAILLKAGTEIPYSDELEGITKGEWNSRLAAFARTFGGVPAGIQSNVSVLEKIRKMRNEFAHGFGRELRVQSPSSLNPMPIHPFSQQTFVKYIGVISKSAASVDKFLLPGFIGNFELVHYYHEWKIKPREKIDRKYDPVRAFQRSLSRDVNTVNTEFCRGLIAYYDAL